MNNKPTTKNETFKPNNDDNNKQNSSINIMSKYQKYNQFYQICYRQSSIHHLQQYYQQQILAITRDKDQFVQSVKDKYQQQIFNIVQKYQQMLNKKNQYIKELEQRCTTNSTAKQQQSTKPTSAKLKWKSKEQKNSSNLSKLPQPFYFHQTPLFQQLCSTTDHSNIQSHPNISQFWISQRIQSHQNSTKKNSLLQTQNSITTLKRKSFSTSRPKSISTHHLPHTSPPKYPYHK